MLKSVQIKGTEWKVDHLSEEVILLTNIAGKASTGLIQNMSEVCIKDDQNIILDVVPASDSIAVFYDPLVQNPDQVIEHLTNLCDNKTQTAEPVTHQVRVCYDMGLDWDKMSDFTGKSKEEIIQIHANDVYEVDMIGFLPGFVYMRGLNQQIHCPRKETPRSRIPEGSVGIGGEYTGIYSLSSPGGWQIIGLSPDSCFDLNHMPPVIMKSGDKVKFMPISTDQYNDLKGGKNEH